MATIVPLKLKGVHNPYIYKYVCYLHKLERKKELFVSRWLAVCLTLQASSSRQTSQSIFHKDAREVARIVKHENRWRSTVEKRVEQVEQEISKHVARKSWHRGDARETVVPSPRLSSLSRVGDTPLKRMRRLCKYVARCHSTRSTETRFSTSEGRVSNLIPSRSFLTFRTRMIPPARRRCALFPSLFLSLSLFLYIHLFSVSFVSQFTLPSHCLVLFFTPLFLCLFLTFFSVPLSHYLPFLLLFLILFLTFVSFLLHIFIFI